MRYSLPLLSPPREEAVIKIIHDLWAKKFKDEIIRYSTVLKLTNQDPKNPDFKKQACIIERELRRAYLETQSYY